MCILYSKMGDYASILPSPVGEKVVPQGRIRGMFAIFTRWWDTMAGSALISQWSEPLTASPAGGAFCLRLAISNVLTSILTYATLSEAIRE